MCGSQNSLRESAQVPEIGGESPYPPGHLTGSREYVVWGVDQCVPQKED